MFKPHRPPKSARARHTRHVSRFSRAIAVEPEGRRFHSRPFPSTFPVSNNRRINAGPGVLLAFRTRHTPSPRTVTGTAERYFADGAAVPPTGPFTDDGAKVRRISVFRIRPIRRETRFLRENRSRQRSAFFFEAVVSDDVVYTGAYTHGYMRI